MSSAFGRRSRTVSGERHARLVLEALPAAVYTTDPDGRLTFYNEAAELWGWRPELARSIGAAHGGYSG